MRFPHAQMRPVRLLSTLAVCAALSLTAGCGKQEKKDLARPPADVTALTVVPRDVPITSLFVAQTQSSQAVNIQARVSGFLDRRVYTEGAAVKSGQVLFLLYAGAVPLLLPPAQLAQILELNGLQLGMLAFCCANTVIAYGCFAEALEHWEVSRVSAVVTLAPIVTVLGMQGAAWLWPAGVPAEPLSGWNLLGASLVVAG